jgi:serine/threonine protein phosphatase 1
MVRAIEGDLRTSPIADGLTVTLGDYVDRGPDSRGVLERLAKNPFPTEYIALKGNHEALLEAFLHDPVVGSHWRQLGGLETLHSYGVPVAAVMIGKGFEEASKRLGQAIPEDHLRFLASLQLSVSVGDYFFCHAGVRPGVALDKQSADDLLWIRDDFLNSKVNFGKVVVHGHTPIDAPEVLPTRINIDTGAFAAGRLTCLVLERERRRFLFTQ